MPTTTPNPANSPAIQPLGDILLLDVTPVEVTTAAGLVLPVAVQPADTRMEATVIARGPDCAREDITPGRRVFIGKYMSNDILRGERKYRLAYEKDVLALLG